MFGGRGPVGNGAQQELDAAYFMRKRGRDKIVEMLMMEVEDLKFIFG